MADSTDRFELIGELGRGGMATVWLANDRLRDTKVALKVLHPHLAGDASARARLVREVAATREIRHPHVLCANEVHELGDQLALSMPLHTGRTLADAIACDGPLDEDALRALGVALADALGAAHQRGVLHRDLTPVNVMVGGEQGPCLMDFGLARVEAQATLTATGGLGTVGYAAPEIYAGERAEPRSDVYGLGALLYLAATGQAPWGEGASAVVLSRQLTGERPTVQSLRPDLDPALAELIERCLAREVDQRPPSAPEVREALLPGQALLPARAEPQARPDTVLDQRPLRAAGRVAALGALGMLAAAVVLFVSGALLDAGGPMTHRILLLFGLSGLLGLGGLTLLVTAIAEKMGAWSLHLAVQRPRPTPLPMADSGEVARLVERVTWQLTHLGSVLAEHAEELPTLAVTELEELLDGLVTRAQRAGREAQGLERALELVEPVGARARLEARLRRLRTEQATVQELAPLEAALEAMEARAAERDELEARYTRLLARLLEIGAAAARTASTLDQGGGTVSLQRLLDRLGDTIDLAASTRDELDETRRGVEAGQRVR